MQEKEILSKVGETFTERPFKIEVDVRPKNFIHKILMKCKVLPSKRVFHIRPITPGNMIRISSKSVLVPEDLFQNSILGIFNMACSEHMDKFIYIVAVGLQNDANEPKEELIELIKNEFQVKDIAKVMDIVMAQMDLESFINSIILMKSTDVLSVKEKVVTLATEQA